jgi:uncharacterized glyoxalase superfamily protein PhnB
MHATPTISPVLRYQDGPAALDWLTNVLGFEKRSDHRTADGAVVHADLRYGSSVVGVSSAGVSAPGSPWARERQGMYVRVSDPDARHDRAVAAGAEIVSPLTDLDYGSRDFTLRDPGGYLWAFGTYDMGATSDEPSVWQEARYSDPAAALDWLEAALGFRRTLEVPDDQGRLSHAELRMGTSVFMLCPEAAADSPWRDDRFVVQLRVADPDAHGAAAEAAGGRIVARPQTAPYGARFYAARDPEGMLWWVSNYSPAPETLR